MLQHAIISGNSDVITEVKGWYDDYLTGATEVGKKRFENEILFEYEF